MLDFGQQRRTLADRLADQSDKVNQLSYVFCSKVGKPCYEVRSGKGRPVNSVLLEAVSWIVVDDDKELARAEEWQEPNQVICLDE